ncbi:MAG: CcdB family protein [Aliishimia sp.]
MATLVADVLMAQFHAYRLSDGMLVLDLQTDLIDTGTRVVAPLLPAQENLRAITRLEPVFNVGGEQLVLHTAELAAVPSHVLPDTAIADLSDSDYAIRGALDMVFSGF